MFEQPQDYRDECDALRELLEPLPDAAFDEQTLFKDYTLHEIVAHLHIFDWAADLSLTDPAAFKRFFGDLHAGLAKGRTLRALTDEWLDGARKREVFERWRDFYPGLSQRFADTDPRARVPWAGPDMSVRSSITARLMETWAHGQAIYDHLGVARVDGDRIRNIAVLGVNTFGWTFANRGLEVPSPVPHVRLTAPSGASWEWNAEVESDLVAGSATEFCQVVAQTRNLADTQLEVQGEVAKRWMSIAQCFAGPVSDPPAPGSRGPRLDPRP